MVRHKAGQDDVVLTVGRVERFGAADPKLAIAPDRMRRACSITGTDGSIPSTRPGQVAGAAAHVEHPVARATLDFLLGPEA